MSAIAVLTHGWRRAAFGRDLARDLAGDAPAFLLAFGYSALAAALLILTGTAHLLSFSTYFVIWSVPFFFVFPALHLGWRVFWIVHRVDRRRALAFRQVFPAQRLRQLASGITLLVALMFFQGAFTSIKMALSTWNDGFPYDLAHADLDQALHGGLDPWRYFAGFAYEEWVQRLVEWNYSQAWFVFCYGLLFVMAVSPAMAKLRLRYMLTYMLTWIVVGNLVAGAWLSAGPAFYGAVTGDEARFAGQLALLARTEGTMFSASAIQHYLWSKHLLAESGVGTGISAFPSMHVALVTLNALFVAELSRRLGLVAAAYVAVICVSSVYLGWHYAIDSYASIVLTLALYWGVRWAFKLRGTNSGRQGALTAS